MKCSHHKQETTLKLSNPQCFGFIEQKERTARNSFAKYLWNFRQQLHIDVATSQNEGDLLLWLYRNEDGLYPIHKPYVQRCVTEFASLLSTSKESFGPQLWNDSFVWSRGEVMYFDTASESTLFAIRAIAVSFHHEKAKLFTLANSQERASLVPVVQKINCSLLVSRHDYAVNKEYRQESDTFFTIYSTYTDWEKRHCLKQVDLSGFFI